jgi:hypothetical protein
MATKARSRLVKTRKLGTFSRETTVIEALPVAGVPGITTPKTKDLPSAKTKSESGYSILFYILFGSGGAGRNGLYHAV